MEALSSASDSPFDVFFQTESRKYILCILACIKYDYQRLSNYISLIKKVTKTVGFLDLETSEASDDTTSSFEEGACGLPKDNDWTVYILSVSCYLWWQKQVC